MPSNLARFMPRRSYQSLVHEWEGFGPDDAGAPANNGVPRPIADAFPGAVVVNDTPIHADRYVVVDNGFGGTTTRKVDNRPLAFDHDRVGPKPASDKSVAYLRKLVAERMPTEAHRVDGIVAQGQARVSKAIERLKAMPPVAKPATGATNAGSARPTFEPVGEGFYLLDGKVYKVAIGERTGRAYASLLTPQEPNGKGEVHGKFVYQPGAMGRLRSEHAITLEQAAEYGHEFSFCAYCGRYLENRQSVERGIGPICWGKYGG